MNQQSMPQNASELDAMLKTGDIGVLFRVNDMLRRNFAIERFAEFLNYLDPRNFLTLNEYLENNPEYKNDKLPQKQITCITCKEKNPVALFLTNDPSVCGKVCRKCFIARIKPFI
jgi:hypothetical protein